MHRITGITIAVGALALIGGVAALRQAKPRNTRADVSGLVNAKSEATQIEHRDLLEHGPKLRPSARALALNEKRVRLVGFMARMEEPIKGGFYLVSRPMSLDESGAGTGDLPLDAVLVLIPGAEGRVIPQMPGALEGIGTFEVGNRSDAEGRVSNFRLVLDPDSRLAQPTAESS